MAMIGGILYLSLVDARFITYRSQVRIPSVADVVSLGQTLYYYIPYSVIVQPMKMSRYNIINIELDEINGRQQLGTVCCT